MKTKDKIIMSAGLLIPVFGFGMMMSNLEESNTVSNQHRQLYSSLAQIVENDGSREPAKQSIKSVHDLQIIEQKALRFAFEKDAANPRVKQKVKAYFEPLENVQWPEYRSRWIKQARTLAKEL